MKSDEETNALLRKLNEDWVLNDFKITKVRKQLKTIKNNHTQSKTMIYNYNHRKQSETIKTNQKQSKTIK